MPVYNTRHTVGKSIRLVLAQSYRNIELIIVDDGSSDGSERICDSFRRNSRVKVIHSEHVGVSRARNLALDAAEGEYVVFCDSDDWMPRNALGKLLEKAEETGAGCVIGGIIYQYADRKEVYYPSVEGMVDGNDSSDRLRILFTTLQGGEARIYRKEIIDRFNLRFDPELTYAEDADFAYRYIALCDSIAAIKYIVYVYNRICDTTSCFGYMRNMDIFCKRLIDNLHLAAGRENCTDEDWYMFNSFALEKIRYSISHYIMHCGDDREKCTALIKETWEMLKDCINTEKINDEFLKKDLRLYILLISGQYEEVYSNGIDEEKKRKQKRKNYRSDNSIGRLNQLAIQSGHFASARFRYSVQDRIIESTGKKKEKD